MSAPRESFTVPRPPDVPPARRFPLIATLAPIIASAVIYAVTRSPFTLVFALLGPVVAIASTADAAVHRRTTRRRETARFTAELAAAALEVDGVHAGERSALERRYPSAVRLCTLPVSWKNGASEAHSAIVRVGLGELASGLADRSPATGTRGPHPELDALWVRAARLAGAPTTIDAANGIGIVGPSAPAMAIARGILLQFAARRSPDSLTFRCPTDEDWEWLGELPHGLDRRGHAGLVTAVAGSTSILVATARARSELPQGLGTVLELAADWMARVDIPGESERRCRPDFVSAEQAMEAARQLRASAQLAGIGVSPGAAIPEEIRFAELPQDDRAGLAASIGRGTDGPLVIDLKSDGPHAIIGGTTGSGKSELLVSWVLAIAAARSPAEVTFLFVDFKGGAAFDPLLELPHCVGLITDLDADQSLRALVSLGAELRQRERMLAALGLRSIDEPTDRPPFPRLVVLVDEYAALLETHSSLHAVFADIAARGRSLGVHLVLCTQRPAGVVRDSILANCALRISLRVMAAADSTAVLGTDAAAALPSRPIGRALVSVAGDPPRLFQVARADRADCVGVAGRWSRAERPRAPWLPPLPAVVERPEVGTADLADDFPFGLADLPDQQAQRAARYRPREHGSLLVVGTAGAGKSGLLAALAEAPSSTRTVRLPKTLPGLWDALNSVRPNRTEGDLLLLLDDLDAIVANCDENYRSALLDAVAELLREGPADGIRMVITVQRIPGALQSVVALCGSLLMLRMPNRQEHVLAGGSAGEFAETLPPGGGHWRGSRVQVYAAEAQAVVVDSIEAVSLDLATEVVAVVSTRPERLAEEIRRAAPMRRVVVLTAARFGVGVGAGSDGLEVSLGGAPNILVSDPDGWQSQWTLLGALQRAGDVLFDGCTLAELRTLTRSRELPPPYPRGERALWLRRMDGTMVRARLPRIVEPANPTGTE